MSGTILVEGGFVAGPSSASDSSFPNGVDSLTLKTTPSPKAYTNREHKERTYEAVTNTALDFTGISATFVYIRSNAAMTLRFTTEEEGAGTEDQPFHGLCIREFDPANRCTGITISGTGTVEYYVSG